MGKPIENWSLGNQLLAMFSGTGDARTYRQWMQVGRHVKKGSKAIYILRPCVIQKKSLNKNTNEEEKIPAIVGFKGIPVFRYEYTEGAALQVPNEPELPPLVEVAKKFGAKIAYDRTRFGEYGSFNSKTNNIRLCTDDPVTFFHELTHLVHSKIEKLKPGQDPEQETIAQLTACVLGKLYGIDSMAYTWNYIAGYSETNSPEVVGRMCLKVLSKVQKILKIILDVAQENQILVPEISKVN